MIVAQNIDFAIVLNFHATNTRKLLFFFWKIKRNEVHVGASIQNTRTEKIVSKSFPFSCSEPPTVLCKNNESEVCEFRSLSLLTFDEISLENSRAVSLFFRCHFANAKRENSPYFRGQCENSAFYRIHSSVVFRSKIRRKIQEERFSKENSGRASSKIHLNYNNRHCENSANFGRTFALGN